jgi:hypothetical protein
LEDALQLRAASGLGGDIASHPAESPGRLYRKELPGEEVVDRIAELWWVPDKRRMRTGEAGR